MSVKAEIIALRNKTNISDCNKFSKEKAVKLK